MSAFRLSAAATAILAVAISCVQVHARDDSPTLVARARERLQSRDASGAIELLEQGISTARGSERQLLLQTLAEGYEMAVKAAEDANKLDQAQVLRDNLSIIRRRLKAKPADKPTSSSETRQPAKESGLEPPPGPTAPTPLPAARTPTPEPIPPLELKPVPTAPGAEPDPIEELLKQEEPVDLDRAVIPPPTGRPSENGQKVSDTLPALPGPRLAPNPSEAVVIPPPSPPAPSQTQPRQSLAERVSEADAHFMARRYDQAGNLYQFLQAEGILPDSRRDHWAYCRWYEVVRKINTAPAQEAEWAAIHREISEIQKLSPKIWYGEYLKNLVAERAPQVHDKGPKGVSPPNSPVASHQIPESPKDEQVERATNVRHTPPPSTTSPLAPTVQTPRGALTANSDSELGLEVSVDPSWQIHETASFRILHKNPTLARDVGKLAEHVRREQSLKWLGKIATTPWSPKCDIMLFPSAADYARVTGLPADSPGFSTMGLNAGRVITRRVNVRSDHPQLLTSVLPHEITHVVVSEAFPNDPIPRWADEGIAVLSERTQDQLARAADLIEPLQGGKVFPLTDLLRLDQPDREFWSLYYAQSVSVTRFLVERGTPGKFLLFLKRAAQRGWKEELRASYGLNGFEDFQKQWLTYARDNASNARAALSEGSAESTSEPHGQESAPVP